MIPLSIPKICGNEWKYVKECFDTNWVSSAGRYVDLFESRFSEFVGAKKAVAAVNGTSALHLAMKCADIKQGDEVIVPSLTFVSPVNAVMYMGASPVFADVCRDTYVMDANRIESLITEKTRAILPVHIYGHPVDMDTVMDIARKYDLYVIEDATESLGSLYKGRHTGTVGHIGCFSFNGNKLITTGGGGMLVTNDESTGEYAKYLSNQAKTLKENGSFYHEKIGYNYRLPNVLAAMGVAQLENINISIQSKRDISNMYSRHLNGAAGITLPVEKKWAYNVHWLYSVLVEDNFGKSRDELITTLRDNGIESRPFFLPVHLMTPYRNCRCGDMDVTIELSEKGLNLPSATGLSEEEILKVCKALLHNLC